MPSTRHYPDSLPWRPVAALATVVLGLLYARFQFATIYLYYDDEGYFLSALTRYFAPGPLAPDTFSHYGPFYYYLQQALGSLIGLPVTHDAGRLLTLVYWIASALLGGLFVYRTSKSLILGSAAVLACVQLGSVLANEPGHPQQVVLFLLTLAPCLTLPELRRNRTSLFLLGTVGAALLFTKINIGAFYLVALAHTLICLLPRGRLRIAGVAVVLAYALLAPPLLMRAHLGSGARGFCLVAVLCGAATFACAARRLADLPLRFRQLLYALAGVTFASAALVFAANWQGVSPAALLQDILLHPAKMPGLFYRGFLLGRISCLFALLTVAGLVLYCLFPERLSRRLAGLLRCAAGLAALFVLVRYDLTWAVPLLPLGVIPYPGQPWSISELFPRLFIANLAAAQFLQTYPVAGSQAGIASVLVALWAVLCIADGIAIIFPGKLELQRTRANDAIGAVILLLIAAEIFTSGFRLSGAPDPPSQLRGAASLHLPTEKAATYRFLAGSIRSNCDVLFTMPRMSSFNFWSGVAEAPGSNALISLKSYTPENQAAVLDALRNNPRACVLYNQKILEFWQTTPSDLARMPLATYILESMPVSLEAAGYQLRTSPHRTSPWLDDRR